MYKKCVPASLFTLCGSQAREFLTSCAARAALSSVENAAYAGDVLERDHASCADGELQRQVDATKEIALEPRKRREQRANP